MSTTFTRGQGSLSIQFSIEWTLEEFSAMAQNDTGYRYSNGISSHKLGFPFIREDELDILGNWSLKIKALEIVNGVQYVAIYLSNTGRNLDTIHSEIQFSVPANGYTQTTSDGSGQVAPAELFTWYMHGFPDFISHTDLFNPERHFLVNDSLTIHAEIQMFIRVPPTHPRPVSSWVKMANDYAALLTSRNGSDLTLVASDGVRIPVHQSILIARSEMFATLLMHDTKEKNRGVCVLPEVDGHTLQVLLEHLYSGSIANIPDVPETLLVAADMYMLVDLIDVCASRMLTNITAGNSGRLLMIADRNCRILKMEVLKYVRMNYAAFVASGSLAKVGAYSPTLFQEVIDFCA